MRTYISVHEVKRLEMGPVITRDDGTPSTQYCVRRLVVYDDRGVAFELTLFAANEKALTFDVQPKLDN